MEEAEEIDGLIKWYIEGHYFKQKKGHTALMPTPKSVSIGGSFQIANDTITPRLIVAADGLDKEGKTNLSLTMPGPIAYAAFDQGHEGVIEKFQTDKVIHRADYFVNVMKGQDQAEIMKTIIPIWDQFLVDWKVMMSNLKAGHIRSGVLDTASEAWEVLRLARFGKLTQVMPHHYTALNTEYRNLIREVYSTPGNLMLLHKLKSEWIDNPSTGKSGKTGGYVRAGYADTAFLVQCNVLCWREKDPQTGQKTGPYHVTIQNSRQNPLAAGVDLVTDLHNPVPEFIPQANFQWLGMSVYPETTPKDWK